MFRLLTCLAALLLAQPVHADTPVVVDPTVTVVPLPPPAPPPGIKPEENTRVIPESPFSFDGPGAIEAGELLELKVIGVPNSVSTTTGPTPAVRIAMYPESKNARVYNNGYTVTFCSPTSGYVWFVASCNNPDPAAAPLMAMKLVEVTGGITPTPPVPPQPPKPPVPPKPDVKAGKRQVVVLYETDDKTPALARVLNGLRNGASNKYIADNKHEFYILDDDGKDETGADSVVVKKFREMAGNTPLPALIVQDLESGEILDKRTLPDTDAAVIEVIKGTGG